MKKSEEIVWQAVMRGELSIDEQGRIWRIAARRGNRHTRGSHLVPCDPRRAENRLPTGYLQVRVMHRKKRSCALAHRLVWRAKHGSIPDGLTINHKNGRKDDNRPDNLEPATYSDQARHAVRTLRVGRTVRQHGEANHAATLTTAEVREIRRRRSGGEKLVSIATDYGIAYQTVSKIARGDRRSLG